MATRTDPVAIDQRVGIVRARLCVLIDWHTRLAKFVVRCSECVLSR
jgi:hypothetical protein